MISHPHKNSYAVLYQAQVPRRYDLQSKNMSPTEGRLRSSGAHWHRALVLRVDGQSPSMRVDPRSTHRPPLGTPRYGEVFLKATWRGVRPTPLKNPQEQRTAWSARFRKSMDFQKRPAKNLAGAPASPASGRGGLAKNLASAPASPCWDVPEGVVLRPP